MEKSDNTTTNRELRNIKTLNAPVDLVWEVWTNPEHIANWWGPNGFTNTIHKMDVQENGEWNLTMHGPDGTNYPNRSVFKEVIPFEKIVFEHFNPHFITTVKFDSKDNQTILDWSMLFDTPEMYDIVVKVHKADQGQRENVEKLEKYLLNKTGVK
nr:SRPBCC family protein [Flavobacterium sp. ASV13]